MSTGRILGFDFGEKRVGCALSDPLGTTAQPLELLERESDEQLAAAISELIEAHEVERVVVGMPRGMSGGDTARTRRTRKFVKHLRRSLGVPVETWDERLSTTEAERTLREMEVKPGRRKGLRDILAAQLILQGYLDHQKASAPNPS